MSATDVSPATFLPGIADPRDVQERLIRCSEEMKVLRRLLRLAEQARRYRDRSSAGRRPEVSRAH